MSIPGSASPLFFTAAAEAAAAGPIKSVRFNSADSAYLNRTPTSAGNRKTWTWSGWVKRSGFGAFQTLFGGGPTLSDTTYGQFGFDGSDRFVILAYSFYYRITTQVFRDPSAWFHVVVTFDTTQATAANRIKLYINGTQVTVFGTSADPTLNQDLGININAEHRIGNHAASSPNYYFNGYLADVHFIDGQALDPTSFGAFDDNGVWQASSFSGSFGTNGFHLFDFANESGIGNDSSGNDNDFSVNNISSTAGAGNDVLFDVPTNGDSSDDTGVGGEVSGNYCTGNPLHPNMSASVVTLSEGNLKGEISSGSSWHTAPCTIGVSSGKWYFEQTIHNSYAMVGIAAVDAVFAANGHHTGTHAAGIGYFNNGSRYTNNTATSYGASYGDGDVIGCAFDMDARSVTFYKNGVSQGEITSIITANKTYAPVFSLNGQDGAGSYTWNFGQRAFAYSAPSGYKALCTTNLPTPTVADGSDYFDTKLYDGNGSTNAITGLEFSPDLVWLKSRGQAKAHSLFDTVRGVNKRLLPNTTDEEYTVANTLTSFDSNGFTLGSNNEANNSGYSHVAWAWDAGTSTVSNTDGTLTSSVRASQTAGTSIVTYTGSGSATSVGHGLGAAPDAIIVKNRSTGGYKWPVYHSGLPANESVALNLAWGYTSISDYFDAPSSTVFNISSDADVNKSGDNFVAYCFSSVEGFSKFGTYVGTGASGSPFVYLGFKPALLIIKKQSSGNWFIHDYKRPGYNQNTGPLRIAPEVELTVTTYDLDLLSNGFVMRTAGGDANGSGLDYIYFAWAENPFQANGGLAR